MTLVRFGNSNCISISLKTAVQLITNSIVRGCSPNSLAHVRVSRQCFSSATWYTLVTRTAVRLLFCPSKVPRSSKTISDTISDISNSTTCSTFAQRRPLSETVLIKSDKSQNNILLGFVKLGNFTQCKLKAKIKSKYSSEDFYLFQIWIKIWI